MAFRRAFVAQRLLNVAQMSSQSLTNCRISSSSALSPIPPPTAATPLIAPDPGDNAVFCRLLHSQVDSQRAAAFSPMLGHNLVHKLKDVDLARNRIRLDGLAPPETSDSTQTVTAETARKLFKVVQLELVRSRLMSIQNNCIPYPEFLRICEECCSGRDQASRIAKMLDDSAIVVILGDFVFLRPEQEVETLLFRQI